MSKFCQNCGKPMADDMHFCESCGAPYQAPAQQPAYQQPVYQQPAYQQPAYQQPVAAPVAAPAAAPAKKGFDVNKTVNDVKKTANGLVNRAKKDKKFMGICIGAAVGVLAIIILLICLLATPGYNGALKNHIKIVTKGKGELIEKVAPKAYWEYYDDEYDDGMEGLIDEYNDDYEDEFEILEDYYGDNIKITFEVTKEKDLSDSKVEDWADMLEEGYEIDAKSVKAVKKLTVKFTMQGSDEKENYKTTLYAVKIGAKWYIMTEYGGFHVYNQILYGFINQIDD